MNTHDGLYKSDLSPNRAAFQPQGARSAENYVSPAEALAPCNPLMGSLNNRISTLFDILTDARGALVETGDRILGAIPRGVCNDAAASKPTGVGGETLLRLEALIGLANEVLCEARRLQGEL
jgi:hypothetical protein